MWKCSTSRVWKLQRSTHFFLLQKTNGGVAMCLCVCAFVERHTQIEKQSKSVRGRKMGKALKPQWILQLSWSSKKQLWSEFWSKTLLMVSFEYVQWRCYRTLCPLNYVHDCVRTCKHTHTHIYTVAYSALEACTVVECAYGPGTKSFQWCLTHFRSDYHHLNGPYELYIIFVKRVLYFESFECDSHFRGLSHTSSFNPPSANACVKSGICTINWEQYENSEQKIRPNDKRWWPIKTWMELRSKLASQHRFDKQCDFRWMIFTTMSLVMK